MSEQGKCPKCGSVGLDYGERGSGMRDETVFYPFTCADCGFKGREYYHLEFEAMVDEQGEEV